MENNVATKLVGKAAWGDGPWINEPDHVAFEHAGLPCIIHRVVDYHGAFCGYVAVPPGHPLHGLDYNAPNVEVHGGLTYADKCQGEICHVPKPGESDDVWWFGFDCHHCFDYGPGVAAMLPGLQHKGEYRTLEYVKFQVEMLAEQLAEVH